MLSQVFLSLSHSRRSLTFVSLSLLALTFGSPLPFTHFCLTLTFHFDSHFWLTVQVSPAPYARNSLRVPQSGVGSAHRRNPQQSRRQAQPNATPTRQASTTPTRTRTPLWKTAGVTAQPAPSSTFENRDRAVFVGSSSVSIAAHKQRALENASGSDHQGSDQSLVPYRKDTGRQAETRPEHPGMAVSVMHISICHISVFHCVCHTMYR